MHFHLSRTSRQTTRWAGTGRLRPGPVSRCWWTWSTMSRSDASPGQTSPSSMLWSATPLFGAQALGQGWITLDANVERFAGRGAWHGHRTGAGTDGPDPGQDCSGGTHDLWSPKLWKRDAGRVPSGRERDGTNVPIPLGARESRPGLDVPETGRIRIETGRSSPPPEVDDDPLRHL
jgi:hypothetical protein